MSYFDDITYERQDYTEETLVKGNYDNCTFRRCNFAGADLKDVNFTDCVFEECDVSMAKTVGTKLSNISFLGCKMLGVKFEHCNPFLFSVSFRSCNLGMASFYQMDIRKTKFESCVLHEADFSEANLQEAVFNDCDLHGAVFNYTKLQKSDFRTAFNFNIDPEINALAKARFSRSALAGLLRKYQLVIE